MELSVLRNKSEFTGDALYRAAQRVRQRLLLAAGEQVGSEACSVVRLNDRIWINQIVGKIDVEGFAELARGKEIQTVDFADVLDDAEVEAFGSALESDSAFDVSSHHLEVASREIYLAGEFRFESASVDDAVRIVPARAAFPLLRSLLGQVYAGSTDKVNLVLGLLDEPSLELFLAMVDQQPLACLGLVTEGQLGQLVLPLSCPSEHAGQVSERLLDHVFHYAVRAQHQAVIVDACVGKLSEMLQSDRVHWQLAARYPRLLLKHDVADADQAVPNCFPFN